MIESQQNHRLFNQELKLRVISAVILAAIVLSMTWIGGKTFTLLWAVAAIAVLMEFTKICASNIPVFPKVSAFIILLLAIMAWFYDDRNLAFSLIAGSIAVLAIWEMILCRSTWAATGLLYSGLPFFAMSDLRGESWEGLLVVLILFACVWGADVFAYFAGRTIGGPKLAPKISPKKTWAGFIGSLVGAVVISWGVLLWAGKTGTPLFWIILVLIAVVSQIGDLLESVLKRKFDVKDSGSIIPGHGGVLDRIDGLIVASVVLWAMLLWLGWQKDSGVGYPVMFVDAFMLP